MKNLPKKLSLILAPMAALSGGAIAHAENLVRFQAPPCTANSKAFVGHPTTVDMTLPPEGIPHGTIDPAGHEIGWGQHPRVWRGNHPQPGWTSMAPTAMIYADRNQPVSPHVRVQVRNMDLFVRPLATNRWCLLEHFDTPRGNLFNENFLGDQSVFSNPRSEPTGGASVRMVPGRNFHFWGDVTAIPQGGLAGVYVQYEARIIPDDDGTAADVAKAAYLGTASSDYWKWAKAPPGHVGVFNEDAAIARFKKLSGTWRLFTMNTDGGPETAPPAH